jgi:AraC-like DNA-binding protein
MSAFLFDSARLPVCTPDDRAYVYLLVSGRAFLPVAGVALEAPSGFCAPSVGWSFEQGCVADGEPHRAIALRIDPRLIEHAPGVAILDARGWSLHRLHAQLDRTEHEPEAISVAIELLERLRSAGVGLSGSIGSRLCRADAREDHRLADGLSRALTVDATRPTLVDLHDELRLSDRQLRRRLAGFLQTYRMPFASWRQLQQSYSLTVACIALSLPGARTEVVSRAVGFASPTGLCHALRAAGLRQPQEIARCALELRRNL